MNKGQANIAMAVAILIAAVIGIVIVDSTSVGIWTTTTVTNESLGTVYNATPVNLANDCAISFTEAIDTTNATVIDPSDYTTNANDSPPLRGTSTFELTDNQHNATTVVASYTYSCTYGGNSTYRIIMEYFGAIVAIAVLGLAGMWLYWKGGF